MSDRTSPYDLHHVRGYPNSLKVYRIPASPYWQCRFFATRKYIRKSTRCSKKSDAIALAKNFYKECMAKQYLDISVHTDTFYACADRMLKNQDAMVQNGERDPRINIEDRKKLSKDILPYFGKLGVASITTAMIEDYLRDIFIERGLSASTRAKHLVVIRKVLNEAFKQGFINALPIFPTIKRKDNPRPYFQLKEFKKLWQTAMKLGRRDIKVRGVLLTAEMHDFIVFHANVFVRPSDLKLLKHKHVEPVVTGDLKYLIITPPNSKTVTRESATMERAVEVYERLVKRHKKEGLPIGNDEYVFFPQYQNRAYALQTIRRSTCVCLFRKPFRKTTF